jgi:hypothetical protein
MFERSFAAPRTFADEHIEYWGVVYVANPQLARRGVLFGTFLLAPVEILAACARADEDRQISRRGLLPQQLHVRMRADREAALREMGERAIAALAADSYCTDGRWIEKLRHHTWRTERAANLAHREV